MCAKCSQRSDGRSTQPNAAVEVDGEIMEVIGV
jgi:hypothetical protein